MKEDHLMVKQKSLFLCLLLLCTFIPIVVPCVKAADLNDLIALIICGSAGGSFSNNTQYIYHVVGYHYGFGFRYLDVYTDRPGVTTNATKENVRDSIKTWLDFIAGPSDIVLIYFTSHGYGTIRMRDLDHLGSTPHTISREIVVGYHTKQMKAISDCRIALGFLFLLCLYTMILTMMAGL